MGGFNTSVAPPSPVALDIRPPQSQSPMEIAAQMQQLQAGRQQLQTNQLQQQELQMNLAQRRAINEAYQGAFDQQSDGTVQLNPEKLQRSLSVSGHGEAIPGIMENYTKYQQSLAGLHETNQKVAAAEQDAAGNLAATVKAANNDPTLFHTLLTDAINRKIIQPAQYAPLDQQLSQALQQDPTGESARALVSQFTDRMIAGSPKQQELANARTTAGARADTAATLKAKETREASQQQFQNAVSQLAANPPKNPQEYRQRLGALPHEVAMRFLDAVPVGSYDPATSVQTLRQLGMTGEQQTTAAQAAANADREAKHNKVMEGQGAQRISLERQANTIRAAEADPYGQLGINPNPIRGQNTDTHGEDFLKTLPGTLAAKVKAVVEGRQPMPIARGGQLRGEGKAISDAVYQYDPEFSTQRAQIRNAFTTGKAADNIGALNTATVHLDQLGDIAKALSNGSFRPGNSVWNSAVTMFGGAAPTNFAGLKSAVAGEMANALKGNATDPEIANIAKAIDSANSPEQLAGVINTHLHTLGAKLNTYQQRYAQQIPNDKTWSPVLPSARAVYEKHGINPTPAPGGGAATTYSHTATGANGHKIGSNDGKTWFDMQTGKQIQ